MGARSLLVAALASPLLTMQETNNQKKKKTNNQHIKFPNNQNKKKDNKSK